MEDSSKHLEQIPTVTVTFVQATFEPERRDPGHRFFFSQKFDLINLFLRLGHSSLLNVSCAQIFRLVVS